MSHTGWMATDPLRSAFDAPVSRDEIDEVYDEFERIQESVLALANAVECIGNLVGSCQSLSPKEQFALREDLTQVRAVIGELSRDLGLSEDSER